MIQEFYTNCSQTTVHLLRDEVAEAVLSALTVAFSLAPAAGGTAIASGNATFVASVTISGAVYYKFKVTITKTQAANMAVGTQYRLTLTEATTGAEAQMKAIAKVYSGD